MKRAGLLVLAAALVAAAGCGQKGPLYLPDKNAKVVTTPASAAPAPGAGPAAQPQASPAAQPEATPPAQTTAPPVAKPHDKDQDESPPPKP